MDKAKIINEFFKKDGTELVSCIAGMSDEKQNSIMSLKASFESERQSKGGCSSCKLRRLTKKYTPQLESIISA